MNNEGTTEVKQEGRSRIKKRRLKRAKIRLEKETVKLRLMEKKKVEEDLVNQFFEIPTP